LKGSETIVHRPCKIIALNDKNILGRPLSEAHLKHHMRLHIPNYDIYQIDLQDRPKGGTVAAVKKYHSHKRRLLFLLSVEVTSICIMIRNTEIYFSTQRVEWHRHLRDLTFQKLDHPGRSPEWKAPNVK
jgi:hypothetical protein